MKLFGSRVVLRALEPDDVDTLYNWENDTSIWHVSNTVAPFSKHQLLEYINQGTDIYSAKQLRLVICELRELKSVGCIDLYEFDPHNNRAGIGVLISEVEERGKGYATEALQLLISYAFETLNLHQLYCDIGINNEASIHLFEKNGFANSGVRRSWQRMGGMWTDTQFMQLINPNG